MIESHGDYREETFLEEFIGGPLYAGQRDMPRLPVPSVNDTIGRFLPTASPLARTVEEKMALKEACQKFPEEAKVLQERLLARRDEFKGSSWLQLWWNQVRITWCHTTDVTGRFSFLLEFFVLVNDIRSSDTCRLGTRSS